MDFNGDGIVNGEDAQALLDYVTGIRTAPHDAEHADLNSDGEINAYDAYLFLQRFNSGVLTLPANGKVEVSVTIRLTSEQKDILRRFDDSAEEAQYKEKKGFFEKMKDLFK